MKIILGGGGTAEQDAPALGLFAELVGRDGHVLYLPITADFNDKEAKDYWHWITETLVVQQKTFDE